MILKQNKLNKKTRDFIWFYTVNTRLDSANTRFDSANTSKNSMSVSCRRVTIYIIYVYIYIHTYILYIHITTSFAFLGLRCTLSLRVRWRCRHQRRFGLSLLATAEEKRGDRGLWGQKMGGSWEKIGIPSGHGGCFNTKSWSNESIWLGWFVDWYQIL